MRQVGELIEVYDIKKLNNKKLNKNNNNQLNNNNNEKEIYHMNYTSQIFNNLDPRKSLYLVEPESTRKEPFQTRIPTLFTIFLRLFVSKNLINFLPLIDFTCLVSIKKKFLLLENI